MIRALIFDFDGVILDSADLKTQAFRRMFSDCQEIDQIVKYHRENMGISRYVKFRHIYEKILNKSYTPEDEKRLGAEFKRQALQAVLATPFVCGTEDFLKRHSEYFQCFIASGTPDTELKAIVKARMIEPFFKEVHGSPPTKTEIVHGILSRYQIKPSETLFIGDAETDRKAAEETGTHFLGRGTDPSQFMKPVKLLASLETLDIEIGNYVSEKL